MRLFDFSTSSGATVFGIGVYGGSSDRLWHRLTVRPLYRAGNAVHRAKWWLRHRLDPRHRYHVVATGLRPGYHDVDELMLHASFSLLVRYVEDEMGGIDRLQKFTAELRADPDPNAPEGLVEGQADRQSEAAELYRWWTESLPSMKRRRAELIHAIYAGREPMRFVKDGETGLSRVVLGHDNEEQASMRSEADALEDRMELEEQACLHRLVEIRRSLWT